MIKGTSSMIYWKPTSTNSILVAIQAQPEAWHTAGGSPGESTGPHSSQQQAITLSVQPIREHIVREWTERGSRSESRHVLPRPSRVCLRCEESGCPVIYCLILTALQPWRHPLSTPAEPSTQAHETLPKAVMSQRSACLAALPGPGSTVHAQWAGEKQKKQCASRGAWDEDTPRWV